MIERRIKDNSSNWFINKKAVINKTVIMEGDCKRCRGKRIEIVGEGSGGRERERACVGGMGRQ